MLLALRLDAHRFLLGPMSMVRSGPEGGRNHIHPSLPRKDPRIFLEDLLPWEHLKLNSAWTKGLGSVAADRGEQLHQGWPSWKGFAGTMTHSFLCALPKEARGLSGGSGRAGGRGVDSPGRCRRFEDAL